METCFEGSKQLLCFPINSILVTSMLSQLLRRRCEVVVEVLAIRRFQQKLLEERLAVKRIALPDSEADFHLSRPACSSCAIVCEVHM